MIIKKRIRKKLIIPIVIFCLAIVSYGVFAYVNDLWPFTSTEKGNVEKQVNDVNYNPPTQQEIDSSQDGKKNAYEESIGEDNRIDLKNIGVGVSFSDVVEGNVEVRAFTPSIIEGDGTCTATLTRSGLKIERSSSAFIESSSSICRLIKIPVTDFPEKGLWNLTVSYKSSTSTGVSEDIEVNIP